MVKALSVGWRTQKHLLATNRLAETTEMFKVKVMYFFIFYTCLFLSLGSQRSGGASPCCHWGKNRVINWKQGRRPRRHRVNMLTSHRKWNPWPSSCEAAALTTAASCRQTHCVTAGLHLRSAHCEARQMTHVAASSSSSFSPTPILTNARSTKI